MQSKTSYPEYRFSDLIAEKQFRFLEYCEADRITPTVVGLLRGMQSRERLTHWARAEHERYGNRYSVTTALGKRIAHVFGYNVEAGELEADDATTDTNHTRERATSMDTNASTATQPSAESPAHHDDQQFESEVQSSYAIISDYNDEAKLVGLLDEETDRGEPRRHVVAAISRRLKEVRASDDDEPSSDSQTPDTQTPISA